MSCRKFRGDGILGLPWWADELIRLGALVLLTVLVLSPFFLAGCSGPYTASALAARQKAVQDCILSGGHPGLGPDDTILCR